MGIAAKRASFVGRARELALFRAARTAGARLVTLTGPEGAGKTTLARRWAAGATHTTWFVDLADARDAEPVGVFVARALGVRLTDEMPFDRLGDALAAHGVALLVLDGLEHLLEDAAAAVGGWLARCADLTVLAISRDPLGLPGEEVIELGPLPDDEAVELFFLRAGAARRDFDADDSAVRALVEKLEPLPLAVELAAAHVSKLSISDLTVRAERRLEALASERGIAPPKRLGMRHVLEWSWDLLTHNARRALGQTSVFTGGFAPDAVTAVVEVADPVGALAGLRRKGLLVPGGPDAPRLALHAIVRRFAAGRTTVGEGRALRARHALYYAEGGDRAAAWMRAGEEVRGLAWLAREFANLRVAHAWGIEHDPEVAARIVLAMEPLFLHRGPVGDLEPIATATLDRPLSPPMRAAMLRVRGAARRALGQLPDAREDLRDAVSFADPDSYAQANALVLLGGVERLLGDRVASRAALDRAAALATTRDDLELAGLAKHALALLLLDLGRTGEAIATLNGACDAFQRRGVGLWEGPALDRLGDLHAEAGDPWLAVELHERALGVHRRVANRDGEAVTLDHLAALLADLGRVGEALALSDAALAMHRELGSRDDAARALRTQAMVLGDAGRHDDARARFAEAVATLLTRRPDGIVTGWLGVSAWECEDLEAAERALDEAVAITSNAPEELLFRAYRAALDADRGLVNAGRADFAALRARCALQPRPTRLLAACDVLEGIIDVAEGALDAACERELRGRATAAQFAEVRPAIRILSRAVAQAWRPESGVVTTRSSPWLVIDPDGLWFEVSGGARVDLARRRPLRLLLRCLAELREQDPGVALSLDALIAAGWPGERVLTDTAAARASSAVRRLRDMGLRGFLHTTADGYLLAPDVPLVRPERHTAVEA